MANSAYIMAKNAQTLKDAQEAFYNAQQKDFVNPVTGLSYKANSWGQLDPRHIKDIINIENARSHVEPEADRLGDVDNKLSTVTDILDGVQKIIEGVQENLVSYDPNNRIANLNNIKDIAGNALKEVILLCNKKTSTGDYVLSGTAVDTKPIDERTLDYKGATTNLELNLNGNLIGEIGVRADNPAIASVVSALKNLSSENNPSIKTASKDLDSGFKEIVRLRLGAAELMQRTQYIKDHYQDSENNLMNDHNKIASQGNIDYAMKLQNAENRYATAIETTKKFLEVFNDNKNRF